MLSARTFSTISIPIRARAGRLQEAGAAVIGKALIGVRYRFPAGMRWPRGYARGQLDEVDMAVALDFTDGATLICSWAMDGFAEDVDVETGPTAAFAAVADRESEFGASDSGPWSGLRGDVLAVVSATWQQRSEYADETAWAVRLSFASGRSVVIALGEVRHGAIQPEIVTCFAERLIGTATA
jgi:hypothetical protein